MEHEIWKPVKNHEDYYEISSKGNVRSKINDKIIVGDTNLEAANDLNTDRGRIYSRANNDQRFGKNNELGLLLV